VVSAPDESVKAAAAREGAEVRHFFRSARAPAGVCVIVPARDESIALPRCLESVLGQDYRGVMRVIVADNGSTDDTVGVAHRLAGRFEAAGHELLILQIRQGNKCAALNAAEVFAVGGCRIYLDADVELSANCVSQVAATLTGNPRVAMCGPRMRIARSSASVTRRYARVWGTMPWVSHDVIGGGFYAVSAAGRRRWGRFPDLLSEDTFVQAQFRRDERQVLPTCHFLVRLPDGLSDLLTVRTRQFSGNRQLASRVGGEWGRAAFPIRDRIKFLLTRPALWPDLPLYAFVNAWARWRCRRRERLGTQIWERGRPTVIIDESDERELVSG
jgi:glycosyltransferase involved in cell wall biosynthesis